MKMKSLLFLGALLALPEIHAQTIAVTTRQISDEDAKRRATEAFKTGDSVAAIAILDANVDKANADLKTEVQLIGQLRQVVSFLANESHPRTTEVAITLLNTGEKSRAKLSSNEDSEWLAVSGGLYETIIGNSAKAKVSYQAALSVNAGNKEAKAGLARIQRIETLITERALENNLLANRPKNTRP